MATRMWRLLAGIVATGLYVVSTGSLAYAHGGVPDPEELGPPLFTSAVLGLMCYMLMITWPRASEESQREARRKKPKRQPAWRRPIRLDSERAQQLYLVKKASNS